MGGDTPVPIADPAATISDPTTDTLQSLTASIEDYSSGSGESLFADQHGPQHRRELEQ